MNIEQITACIPDEFKQETIVELIIVDTGLDKYMIRYDTYDKCLLVAKVITYCGEHKEYSNMEEVIKFLNNQK
jgi:hypothetical protein